MLGHLRNVALLLRAQRSSRHKNFRISWLMFNNQHISSTWNSTLNSLYPGFSKQNVCSSTYPRKEILLADKCDNYLVTSKIRQLLVSKANGIKGETSVFPFGGGGKESCFTMDFSTWFSIPAYYKSFGHRKLSQRQHVCCSDDLAQLSLCLDLWSLCSGPKIYQSIARAVAYLRAYTMQVWAVNMKQHVQIWSTWPRGWRACCNFRGVAFCLSIPWRSGWLLAWTPSVEGGWVSVL